MRDRDYSIGLLISIIKANVSTEEWGVVFNLQAQDHSSLHEGYSFL